MTPQAAFSVAPYRHIAVTRPGCMIGCLLLADSVSLSIAVLLSVGLKRVLYGPLDLGVYLSLWPFLALFLLVYTAVGLYSGVALSPPEELRRATLVSTVVFLFLAASTVSMRGGTSYFTPTLFAALTMAVLFVPLVRALVRQRLAGEPWWGYPAVIFGADENGRTLVRMLRREPELGLKPVAIIDELPERAGYIEDVPILQGWQLRSPNRIFSSCTYGVALMPSSPQPAMLTTLNQYAHQFSHLLLVPNLPTLSTLWVSPKRVGGLVGLEVRQHVLAYRKQMTKRFLDIALTTLGSIGVLPLLLVLALSVKLDSRGPVFYGHYRIGRGGRSFRAWKLRTMVCNSEEVLKTYLEQNPLMRLEWETSQKLKSDPRITRVGRLLRRTSLDELPQLWNVLKGEMSLVGPRPIVAAEVPRYGDNFSLYTAVPGGLTGLWQVSGRNDTSYAERVSLDSFYARNWSVWLDLCILFRTIGTVVFRRGAY